MKPIVCRRFPGTAFTLIELLVVIAVIGILAGLLLAAMPQISTKRSRAVAYSELFQIQTAIEAFKTTYGIYPPDNTNSVYVNQLYYELVGTTNTPSGNGYGTLDGRDFISQANVGVFYVSGFVNSSASAKGTDERAAAVTFLKEVKRAQIGTTNNVQVLVCSEQSVAPNSKDICAWRYNSSKPVNNPASYDLWVDLYLGGRTNRISNWSKQPELF